MIDSIAHSPYQVGKDDPIVKNLQNFLNFNAEQIEVFLQYCHYADLRQTEEINIRKEGMKLCTELMMKLLQKRKTTPPPQTPATITTNPPPTPPAYSKNNTFIESQNVQQQQQQTSKNNTNVVDDDVDFGIVEIDDIYEDDDEDEDDSLRFAPPPHNIKSSSSSSTTFTKTPKPTNKRVSIDLGHKSPTNHAHSKRKDAEEGVPIDYYALPRRKVPSSRHFGSCLMQKSLSPTSSLPNTPKTILDFTLPKGLLTLKSHPQLYTIGKFNDVVIGKFREKFKIFMKTIPTTSINLQTSKTCSNNPCLENELLILQSLGSYPTIFSCYGSIVEGNYFHIIYPLPVYGSLLHIILEGGGSSGVGSGGSVMNIPTPLILAWMYDLSDAIQFLHCHGIIHQNITAENCYLFDNLQLKLGNFQSSYSIYDNDETTGINNNRCNNNNNSNEQRQQRPSSSSSSYFSSIPSVASSISSLSTPTNNTINQNNNNCYVSDEAQKLLPQFQTDIIGFWNTSLELISRKPLDKILLLLQKQNKEQLLNTSFLLSNPYILNHFPKLIPSLIALLRTTLPPSPPLSSASTTPLQQQYEKKGSKLMMATTSMIKMSSKELSEELYNILEVQFQGDPRERVNQRFKKSLRVFEQSIQHLNVHVHTSSSSPTSVSSSFSNFFPMKSLSSSSSSPHLPHPPAASAGTPSPSHLSSFFHLFGSNKKHSHDRPQSSPQQQQQQLQLSANNTNPTSSSSSSLHLSCTTSYFSDLTSQQSRSLSRSNSYRGVVTPSFDKERMVIDYRRELVSWLVDKVKIKVALAEEVTVALIKHGLLIPEQIKRKHHEDPKALTDQLSGKIDSDVLQKILKYLQ